MSVDYFTTCPNCHGKHLGVNEHHVLDWETLTVKGSFHVSCFDCKIILSIDIPKKEVKE